MPTMPARALRRRPALAGTRGLWVVPDEAGTHLGEAVALLLTLVTLTFFFLVLATPDVLPWAAFLPLIVVSGVVHRPREHSVVVLASLGSLVAGGVLVGGHKPGAGGTFVAGAVIAVITMWRSSWRARVGVQGIGGESLLVELRDGLRHRSHLPDLPAPWCSEVCIASAFGHPFSGDFVVAHRSVDGDRLEVVLIDVSGRGLRSASRAVQLSGAVDALLGAVPAADLLAAANDYVLRQGWTEGFATAVHLAVDLVSGEYVVRRAGHPPAALLVPGRGAWRVVDDAAGPALGLLESPDYRGDEGRLRPGDALLLYSDGLVEQPDRPVDEGIARLLDHVVQAATAGLSGVASRLCSDSLGGQNDDRSVVLLWRT